jgi:hypothetical protein
MYAHKIGYLIGETFADIPSKELQNNLYYLWWNIIESFVKFKFIKSYLKFGVLIVKTKISNFAIFEIY